MAWQRTARRGLLVLADRGTWFMEKARPPAARVTERWGKARTEEMRIGILAVTNQLIGPSMTTPSVGRMKMGTLGSRGTSG